MKVKIYPSQPLGEVNLPAAKSLCHRSLICAALAKGTSVIKNLSNSLDIEATLEAVAKLGAKIELQQNHLTITGIGGLPKTLPQENLVFNCKESGSTLRFLIPLLAAAQIPAQFIGTGKLLERPQNVYAQIFAQQNLSFQQITDLNGKAKIAILANNKANEGLKSGTFSIPGNISSQFITGLLFALPCLKGNALIKIIPPFESASYVNLTLDALKTFGIKAQFIDPLTIEVIGNQTYLPTTYAVEGDFSQAAFFAVLAAIKGKITCHNLNPNSMQGDKVITQLIAEMGGQISQNQTSYTITQGNLQATTINLADCPDLGPILAVLAAYSQGTTNIINAQRLAIKESNRLSAIQQELSKAGVKIEATPNSLVITGAFSNANALSPYPEFSAHNDHRIAMSLAVFLAVGNQPGIISQAESVEKSYPDFFADLAKVGIKAEVV